MQYGLIGKKLSHSFSQQYFTAKFARENIHAVYHLFELAAASDFLLLKKKHHDLRGLNVTIPYKQEVIPFLTEISEEAAAVGAVNTIKFLPNGNTKGYNTDIYGFYETVLDFVPNEMQKQPLKALILGTGGAALAVEYVIKRFFPEWKYFFISRKKHQKATFLYEDLEKVQMSDFSIIINTTPLGMYPHIQTFPSIPYAQLSEKHFLIDLVYNPAETIFLKKGKEQGAQVCNGLKMLYIQAEKAYNIWQKS